MYLNALEFLEEERELWRPYEALDSLTDEQLDTPIDEAHDWSGRDLIGHLVAWQANALQVAKELAVGERSATKERSDAEWAERGDAINLDIQVEWRAMPMAEVRRRFRETPGELRGYLTVVPEVRWLKHADNLGFFVEETIDHYNDHAADLEAILDACAAGAPDLPTQKALRND
jgi:Mycothiol maleylpyruvate isomerase N-terminal domain